MTRAATRAISLIPPGTGGVRDYAAMVGERLQAPVIELTRDTDVHALQGDCVFLHFSGYGFQKRGVPLWLVDRVRAMQARSRIVGVVFHELFASGPPWGSAFWLSGLQRRIARQLACLADFWLTNREDSARWLLAQRGTTPHRVLPVFSNVGEPAATDDARAPQLVVFGSSGIRAQVYEWHDGEIFAVARRLGLQLHDVGPSMPPGAVAERLRAADAICHGKLPAAEVSRILSNARYGAVAYPADYASKSGVFAAYCAHALCPILLSNDYQMHDGLTANVNYVAGFGALERQDTNPREVGRRARAWYEPHGVGAHAKALQTLATEACR